MATVNQFGRMIKVDLYMKKNTNDNMIIAYTTATVISQFLCKKCGECTSIKMQKIM